MFVGLCVVDCVFVVVFGNIFVVFGNFVVLRCIDIYFWKVFVGRNVCCIGWRWCKCIGVGFGCDVFGMCDCVCDVENGC